MASSSTSKAPCATCSSKGIGIFKCEGCAQVFCRKHANEHRDILSQQLDEIVLAHDTLQQTIVESKDKPSHHHPLIKQIDKWEKHSIEKIHQTAYEARQQVNALTSSSKGTMSKDLHELAERLRKAREEDDYVETDLRTWTTKLEQLKNDTSAVSPLTRVCEDSTKVFISRIYLSVTQPTLATVELFGEFIGNVRVENDGRVASHSGFESSSAYVRGKKEYSKGKHQIRFVMNKCDAVYTMSFNIASKSTAIMRTSDRDQPMIYGWHTDDGTSNPDSNYQPKKGFKDFRGKTKFELQMTLDCDNRKISYFNEQTKKTHELNVNTELCPFPWQLEFYLFDIGDRVELLSSTQVF